MKLGAKQLRVMEPTAEQVAGVKRKPIYFVLDNVLDTYNIGSIFRLADAVAASGVVLCGECERPPSQRIHKAAVGTERWVPWWHEGSAVEALKELKVLRPNLKIVAVEQDSRSVSLNRWGGWGDLVEVAVVVGHETNGVSRGVVDVADVVVEIPMWGVNKSLNVHVSAAIVVYKLLEGER